MSELAKGQREAAGRLILRHGWERPLWLVWAALLLIGALLGSSSPSMAQEDAVNDGGWCTAHAEAIDIQAGDCQALEDLYKATGGEAWTNKTGWFESRAVCTDWQGIECGGDRVTTINLENNNLSGALPDSIGTLSSLEVLNLTENNIGGELPATLGDLERLADLWLGSNAFSGAIPAELGDLLALQRLDLGDNQLSGEIPAALGKSGGLNDLLFLDGNQLEGPVPQAVCDLNPPIATLNYNKLDIYDTPLSCDDSFPDWWRTQTAPPSGLAVGTVEVKTLAPSTDIQSTFVLTWQPIAFNNKAGHYEVFARRDGEVRSLGPTVDKSEDHVVVTLKGDPKSYEFFLRTKTEAHDANRQALSSEDGLAATTGSVPFRRLEIQPNLPLLYIPALAPLILLLAVVIGFVRRR